MPVSEVHRCQFFSSDSTFAPVGEREGMRTKTEMDMKEFHQTAIQSEDSHYVYFDLRSFGNRQGEAADSYMHDALMTIQAGGRISGERTVILITDVSTVIPDTARNRLAELRDAGVSISVQGRRS
jgi:hypothetical protein